MRARCVWKVHHGSLAPGDCRRRRFNADRAFPSAVRGPELSPPWQRHLPFASAFARQDLPVERANAPQHVFCFTTASCQSRCDRYRTCSHRTSPRSAACSCRPGGAQAPGQPRYHAAHHPGTSCKSLAATPETGGSPGGAGTLCGAPEASVVLRSLVVLQDVSARARNGVRKLIGHRHIAENQHPGELSAKIR